MRSTLSIVIGALIALSTPTLAQAQDGELARRGLFLGTGGGFLAGTATDEDDRSAGLFLGGGGLFRFGEEALPGLTLGLEIWGGSGSGTNDRYSTGLGGFVLQASWRPFDSLEGLVILLGTGVGGGSLDPQGDDGFEGLMGGSFHEVGLVWEFVVYRDGDEALALSPTVRWLVMPTTADSPVWLQTVAVGFETVWYLGKD